MSGDHSQPLHIFSVDNVRVVEEVQVMEAMGMVVLVRATVEEVADMKSGTAL